MDEDSTNSYEITVEINPNLIETSTTLQSGIFNDPVQSNDINNGTEILSEFISDIPITFNQLSTMNSYTMPTHPAIEILSTGSTMEPFENNTYNSTNSTSESKKLTKNTKIRVITHSTTSIPTGEPNQTSENIAFGFNENMTKIFTKITEKVNSLSSITSPIQETTSGFYFSNSVGSHNMSKNLISTTEIKKDPEPVTNSILMTEKYFNDPTTKVLNITNDEQNNISSEKLGNRDFEGYNSSTTLPYKIDRIFDVDTNSINNDSIILESPAPLSDDIYSEVSAKSKEGGKFFLLRF